MKRSLRDYLMTLFLAVLIFSVVGVFLIQAAEGLMEDVVVKIGSEAETQEEVPATEEETKTQEVQTQDANTPAPDVTATFLLLGLDEGKRNADAIFLVGLNATKKQATVALIPSNTVVPEGTKKYQLGSLYSSRGMNFYKEFIQQETGILADYFAAMPMSAFSNLIDILGGITYQVPQDMYYSEPENKLKINLKAGKQTLSGDQALQLLRYQGYPGGVSAREDTQLSFVRSFCTTFLVPSNLSRASAILNNMYYNCEMDFEEKDLKQFGEVIFNLSTYTQNYTRIPGAPSGSYYAISTPRAKSMFEAYRH